MSRLVVALLVTLSVPTWSAAGPFPHDAPHSIVTLLPGADVGVSPHATWNAHGPDAGLALVGVQGARLVVDDGLRLHFERSTVHTRILGWPLLDEGVQELTLEFRRADMVLGTLDLKSSVASVELGPALAGESIHASVVFTLSPSASLDSRLLVRLQAEAQVAPDEEP